MMTKHHILNKTNDDEQCVLRILVTEDKLLSFSNHNVQKHSLFKKNRWTPVEEHWVGVGVTCINVVLTIPF